MSHTEHTETAPRGMCFALEYFNNLLFLLININ